MSKLWKQSQLPKAQVDALQDSLGIHPALCKALVQRGVHTFEEARGFFRYTVADLHEPLLMRDMRQAVERIDKALIAQEKILIFGDYDVDGTTGVALLYRFLKKIDADLDYYLPDRHKEGYGLSVEGIQYAKDIGARLLISVDCGIKAIEQTALAKSLGIDVLICDHHMPYDTLPDAVAVLNPMRPDCPYPFKGLSGAGVAFKLCQALVGHFGLEASALNDVLDLLCLSICCDLVPILGENRILAHIGLHMLNKHPSVAVQALIEQGSRRAPLGVSDVVYGLGPIINAAGRLGHAQDAVRLLVSEDADAAKKQAQFLAHQNRQRRIMDAAATKNAVERILDNPASDDKKSIVLYSPDWHKGILGILAARVAETFNRPTVIFTDSDDGLTASARSIQGFNLYESLQACATLFDSFGGHRHAAGIRMKKAQLEAFTVQFETIVADTIDKAQLEATIEVLSALDLQDITPKFMAVYRQFAPFGPKNRRPVFFTKNIRLHRAAKYLRDDHVQLSVTPIGEKKPYAAIAFGLAPLFKELDGNHFDMCYTIKEEYWQGQWRLKLHIKDVRPAE